MVVDKDMQGLGEWTLGEVKQSGYVHLLYCSSYGRLKAEGMSVRLVNFLCTGRIVIGARLDVVCWGISNILLASLDTHDNFLMFVTVFPFFFASSSIFVPPSSLFTCG